MRSFVQSLNLDDEDASYTIEQMMAHLQEMFDWWEYEKVRGLLSRLEEQIRGEAIAEVERVREFAADMVLLERDLAGVEGRYVEQVEWKLMVEERLSEVENENGELVEENRELQRVEEAAKVRVLELETKAEVDESLRECI